MCDVFEFLFGEGLFALCDHIDFGAGGVEGADLEVCILGEGLDFLGDVRGEGCVALCEARAGGEGCEHFGAFSLSYFVEQETIIVGEQEERRESFSTVLQPVVEREFSTISGVLASF